MFKNLIKILLLSFILMGCSSNKSPLSKNYSTIQSVDYHKVSLESATQEFEYDLPLRFNYIYSITLNKNQLESNSKIIEKESNIYLGSKFYGAINKFDNNVNIKFNSRLKYLTEKKPFLIESQEIFMPNFIDIYNMGQIQLSKDQECVYYPIAVVNYELFKSQLNQPNAVSIGKIQPVSQGFDKSNIDKNLDGVLIYTFIYNQDMNYITINFDLVKMNSFKM